MKLWSGIIVGLLVVAFTMIGCTHRPPGPDDPGWTTLIDGTRESLDNWNRYGNANWRFEYGEIVSDGKAAGHLVSKNSYTDFQIRAEFWASHDANSGIFVRISDPKKIGAVSSYEVNVYDTRPDPSYGTGAIVNFATVNPMPRAGGRWNVMEISATGNRISVWFNGVLTVDMLDSKFKSGPFSVQHGSGVMKWRKLQVRAL